MDENIILRNVMKKELAIEIFAYIEVDDNDDVKYQSGRLQDVLYQAGFESKINETFVKPKENKQNG